MQPLISFSNIIACQTQFRLAEPINWTLRQGENWAVVGPNGSGKTLFARTLSGKIASCNGKITLAKTDIPLWKQVRYMEFHDARSVTDYSRFFHQQRWHSSEEPAPTVADILGNESLLTKNDIIYNFFVNICHFDKQLIQLSNGEMRKLLIVKALLERPQLLVLDNPYIGLDASSRLVLDNALCRMISDFGLNVMLLLSDPADVPDFVDFVLPMQDKVALESMPREAFIADRKLHGSLFPEPPPADIAVSKISTPDYVNAFEMRDVCVRYGKRTIIEHFDWTVARGDRWLLTGANGSGKSTLLSLVCADNPQAYANRLYVFDRRRGGGESIWDIKRRIGYLSPEIHLYYNEVQNCLQTVCSGYFDTIGLFRVCTAEQSRKALDRMAALGIQHLADRPFRAVSFGEQRLVMLARALIRDPEMLILDEPLHGLDCTNRRRAQNLIETLITDKERTLVYVTHYPSETGNFVSKMLNL
jgi:molybdate transport system ATP-binding protein